MVLGTERRGRGRPSTLPSRRSSGPYRKSDPAKAGPSASPGTKRRVSSSGHRRGSPDPFTTDPRLEAFARGRGKAGSGRGPKDGVHMIRGLAGGPAQEIQLGQIPAAGGADPEMDLQLEAGQRPGRLLAGSRGDPGCLATGRGQRGQQEDPAPAKPWERERFHAVCSLSSWHRTNSPRDSAGAPCAPGEA